MMKGLYKIVVLILFVFIGSICFEMNVQAQEQRIPIEYFKADQIKKLTEDQKVKLILALQQYLVEESQWSAEEVQSFFQFILKEWVVDEPFPENFSDPHGTISNI